SHASDTTQHTPTVPYTLPLHDALPILGRLKRYKGVETAVRAVALARSKRPDVTLEIAGQGDDRIRLERLARALRQADAVRFLGFVSEEAKRRLLRRAWAVVLPSPKEGWGISNVEAAACGT